MARNRSIDNGVKYTVVLPESDILKLKELAKTNVIRSINSGVREAVTEYITKLKKDMYTKELSEAVKDPEFIKRNNNVQQSFESSDRETEEMITEW